MNFWQFLLSRIVTYILVIWIGVTFVFLVPRFLPSDPVQAVLGRMKAQQNFMQPAQVEAIRTTLMENFGLKGTLGQQYISFLKRVLVTGDFGPSLTFYPTPVSDLVHKALPWSFGLLLVSTIISWIVGNLMGMLAGYWKDNLFSKGLEAFSIIVYPIPYYILALVLIILLAYVFPIFPFSFNVQGKGLSWVYIKSVVHSSVLPLLSIVLVSLGWWVMTMKALASAIAEEDFVQFAKYKGVGDREIMLNYISRNALLPQITVLALELGGIFSGALMTEILFGYPGIGTLIYQSVLQSDYNLMLGTISLSIVAVSTATMLIDLLYPVLDPRIRHR